MLYTNRIKYISLGWFKCVFRLTFYYRFFFGLHIVVNILKCNVRYGKYLFAVCSSLILESLETKLII